MADGNGPGSFGDFDARLKRLREADPKGQQATAPSDQPQRLNWGAGMQIGVELLAGVLGGLLLGYALDRWLGMRPLFMIVFFFLGSAAGMLNAYRSLQRMQEGKRF